MIHPTCFTPRLSRRAVTVCGLSLAVLSISFGAAVAAPPVRSVEIDKFRFAPEDIVVEPGTTVRWTNRDEIPHTVTSQSLPRAFASKALDTDDQYEFTFTHEGDFGYFCTVHPMMTGVVHVRAAAPARGTPSS